MFDHLYSMFHMILRYCERRYFRINFHGFMKMGNFARIKIRVIYLIGSLG